MENHEETYWHGFRNRGIRWFFYCNRGLDLFNQFRYLFIFIAGLYVLAKMNHPIWMVFMFIITIPILIVVGWYQVNYMAKVIDWLGIQFGSYWARYQFELQERSVKALEDIDRKTPEIDV